MSYTKCSNFLNSSVPPILLLQDNNQFCKMTKIFKICYYLLWRLLSWYLIICHSISMGAGSAVSKSDWSRAGFRMDSLVLVYSDEKTSHQLVLIYSHRKTTHEVREFLPIWILWKHSLKSKKTQHNKNKNINTTHEWTHSKNFRTLSKKLDIVRTRWKTFSIQIPEKYFLANSRRILSRLEESSVDINNGT